MNKDFFFKYINGFKINSNGCFIQNIVNLNYVNN